MPTSTLQVIQERGAGTIFQRKTPATLARLVLLALVFYAPWAFGSTRPALVDFLDNALLLAFGLHVVGLALERRKPRYPWLPLACLVLLIVQAAWMWCNARFFLDEFFWQYVPLVQPFPGLPGTWNKVASFLTLKAIAAFLAAFLVGADLVADPDWKLRLWRAFAMAGTSVALYGLIQKGVGDDLSMYRGPDITPTFFGPFRYHGNAGSYLNLVWPVLLALLILAWRKREAHLEYAFWSFAFVIAVSACYVNTSRAASAITSLMLIVALLAFRGFFREIFVRSRAKSRTLAIVFGLVFIGILLYGGMTSQVQQRWKTLVDPTGLINDEGRPLVYQTCLRMIPEAGWFGYGPGTFSSVFPFHTGYLKNQIQGFWMYAHEDYLQTVLEYGYVGSALWSILFFGSIGRAVFMGWFRPGLRTTETILYRAGSLSLGTVALHSLVDFPMQVPSIQLYIALFFALAWSAAQPPRGEAGARGR